MGKIISKKRRVDANKYVNIDTGELLSSEHDGSVTSVNVSNNDLVKIKSDDFVITDSRTINYLLGILSKSDMGYVHRMIHMVYGSFNILYDKERFSPHTTDSLMSELDLARTAFSGLINRLYKKGVLYHIVGYVNRRKVKYLMLNPSIGRKTNQIQRECLKYFENLSDRKRLS